MNDNNNSIGDVVAIMIIISIIIFSILSVYIAGIGGIVWGVGTAVVNYFKSFKENMIDSNRATT